VAQVINIIHNNLGKMPSFDLAKTYRVVTFYKDHPPSISKRIFTRPSFALQSHYFDNYEISRSMEEAENYIINVEKNIIVDQDNNIITRPIGYIISENQHYKRGNRLFFLSQLYISCSNKIYMNLHLSCFENLRKFVIYDTCFSNNIESLIISELPEYLKNIKIEYTDDPLIHLLA
jgi:hypothetical protein